jgi:hypothetical protein
MTETNQVTIIEMHEYRKYKIFGITVKIQLPELIDPHLFDIRMIERKPRYCLFLFPIF